MTRRLVFSLGLLSCLLLFSAQVFAIEYGDADAGGQKYQQKGCTSCHGEGGRSSAPTFPILAGQYADYLATALQDYKEGDRKNPIMTGMAGDLSEADIYDIAAYLSHERSALSVLHEK
ncbi:MAG: cytochrome c [Nitrococcus mobilis]|nr:cytochrome c [Nitrococcus mobilis]